MRKKNEDLEDNESQEEVSNIDESQPDSSVALDTNMDYYKWRNDPFIQKKIQSITKDIPLSNLTPAQEFIITEHFDVLFQLLATGRGKRRLLMKSANFLEAQIHAIANTSLGRTGFARRMDASSFKEEKITKNEPKKQGWFRGKN